MLPHLPPTPSVLDRDWTECHLWALLREKSQSTSHGPPSGTNGDSSTSALRNQEAASERLPAGDPESRGWPGVAAAGVGPGAPRPPGPPAAASSHTVRPGGVLHSAAGRMFWLRACPVRPEGWKERRLRSRFSISRQLLRYWRRSKEYTKGSDAALP